MSASLAISDQAEVTVAADVPSAIESGFTWDEMLYAGSAAYYATGRVPYPAELADALATELGLDGSGRLLDCGCGPGMLTLVLAPLFADVVGIDADGAMVEQASLRARTAGLDHVSFRQLRAEDLPADLGAFGLVTFAQSFHWVDQPTVARTVRQMLTPGGACALIFANTHEGMPGDDELSCPRPPRAEIAGLVRSYLGPVRRAGRGTPPVLARDGGDGAMRMAGFAGPRRLRVDGLGVLTRTEDEVVASVFSLSWAAPHLFGDRLGAFEADLRAMLRAAAPDGRFAERMAEIAVEVWRSAEVQGA